MSEKGKSKAWALFAIVIMLTSALSFGGGYKWAEATLPTADGVWGQWFRDAYVWVSTKLHLDYTTANRVLITDSGKNATTDADLTFVGGDTLQVTNVSATDVYTSSLYINGNKFYPENSNTYTIWNDTLIYAKNGHTGVITSNANPVTLVNACFTAGGAGTNILMKKGTYTTGTTGITFTANSQVLAGEGVGTFINGDALLTANHAISNIGFTDCIIQDLSVQTEDGGGKTSHCVNIEDAAFRSSVCRVTILESDSDGIHIEGVSSTGITVKDNHVLDADDYGIHVKADGGATIQYMGITGNEIVGTGLDGIFSEGGTYVNFNVISNNIIKNAGKSGIGGNWYESTISVNVCIANTEHGIKTESSWNAITGNHCESNVLNGIFLDASDSQCVGNTCISNGYNGIYSDGQYNLIEANACIGNTRHGIYATTGHSQSLIGNKCSNNDVGHSGNYDGIFVDAYGALISGNRCSDNYRHGINVAQNYMNINGNYCFVNIKDGIHLYYNSHNVNGNYCYLNTQDGIGAGSSDNFKAGGNYVTGNGRNGIFLSDCDNCFITENECFSNTGVGLKLDFNADNNVILSNYCKSNTGYDLSINSADCNSIKIKLNFVSSAAKLSDSGTGTSITENINYVTENSGTATILNGATNIAFAHGLSATPLASWFSITFTENPTNPTGNWWLTCNATHAVLNVGADPGASNLDFSWQTRSP